MSKELLAKNGQVPQDPRRKYEELLEKMQCSLEVAEVAEPERLEGSLLGGVPFIQGISDLYPWVGAFLSSHLIGPENGPRGSSMLWVNEEGLTVMVYIRDTEVKAFFNGMSLEACLSDAEAFLSQDPIPWKATRKARQKASRRPKTPTSKPR